MYDSYCCCCKEMHHAVRRAARSITWEDHFAVSKFILCSLPLSLSLSVCVCVCVCVGVFFAFACHLPMGTRPLARNFIVLAYSGWPHSSAHGITSACR